MIFHAGGLQRLQNPTTGKLAPGVHRASIGGLRDYSVTNARRERIWSAFETWRLQAVDRLAPTHYWIGGSFITSKDDPNDIDVVAWLPLDSYRKLRQDEPRHIFELSTLQHIDFMADGDENVAQLERLQPMGGLVDGYPVGESAVTRRIWQRQFTNDWTDRQVLIPGTEKGIVEVIA